VLPALVIGWRPDRPDARRLYAILKRLAWQNLNVVDVVSTATEFTIVVSNEQVDQAFSALRRYFWP
jgi:hypothetical protein